MVSALMRFLYRPHRKLTLSALCWFLDSGKHVVFGRVIAGKSLVRTMENLPTDSGDKPSEAVTITDCGELGPNDPLPTSNKIEGDVYEDFPDDDETVDEGKPEQSVEVASKLKDIGAR